MVEEADTRSPSGQHHEERSRETLRRVNQELEERVRERTALYELANAALQESEERLRTVIGNAPVVLFALDVEGVFTLAEGKGLDDLGIASDELVGRSMFDMFTNQPEVHESVRKALAGEPATAIVGINTTFEARLTPMRDEAGNVTGVIGVATDITERTRAEEARQRYVSLIENSSDFIGMATLDGQVTFVNEAGLKLVGLNSLEDVQSRTMYEFLMEDDLQTFEQQMLPEIMEKGRWQGEFRLRHFTSGAGIPIDMNLFTISREETGEPIGIATVSRDITERKQAEEALRESEEMLIAIVESTADGILVVNSGGHVIYANERFAEMWRIPEEVLETRDREKLLAHVADQLEDPEEFLAKAQNLYQTSQEVSDVLSFKDGRIFERFSRPLLTGSDAPGRVWSFRDVTEQKRVEQALRDAANHDPLTGLLNRRAGNAAIEDRLTTARGNDKSFAMMVLDLDRFKSINDSFGHETGDSALVQFADVLSELVGESGVVCRIGGDEFGIGMEDVNEDQAFSFARRVQTSLRRALASSDMELRPQFTVSIGIACYPDDGDNVSVLGRRADRAMYEAKVAGCDTSRAWRQIDSSQAA